jgi:alpha-L-rhamnosidase
MGATTVWERWDSLRPDGSVNPGQMTSFNHYAFGAVADWLHRTAGGLAPAAPGYRRLDVRPRPGGVLTHARARHRTPYGLAEVAWRIEGGQIAVEVVVPPNTAASVTLPGSEAEPVEVGSGTHRWSYQLPVVARPPLTLDSTLGELIDDAAAWEAALTAVPGLARFEVGLQGRDGMTLGQAVSLLPHADESRAALEAALAALVRSA